MEEKYILVTGGCGYIGSHMVYRLKDRYRIVVIDNLSTGDARNQFSDVIYVTGDVGDTALLKQVFSTYAIEIIIHLAAKSSVEESMQYPQRYYSENVDKTLLLMREAIIHHTKHFIFSSSASVYGNSPDALLSETAALVPCSVYGKSKLLAEEGLQKLSAESSIKLFVFRYFNVAGHQTEAFFGNFQTDPSTLIQKTARGAVAGNRIVPVFGSDYETPDGTCIRDYVHVEDIVYAHELLIAQLMENGRRLSSVYNIGYGEGTSVLEVIKLFNQYVSEPLRKKIYPKRAGDLPVSIADSQKIQKELSWKSLFKNPHDQIVQSELVWAEKFYKHINT